MLGLLADQPDRSCGWLLGSAVCEEQMGQPPVLQRVAGCEKTQKVGWKQAGSRGSRGGNMAGQGSYMPLRVGLHAGQSGSFVLLQGDSVSRARQRHLLYWSVEKTKREGEHSA